MRGVYATFKTLILLSFFLHAIPLFSDGLPTMEPPPPQGYGVFPLPKEMEARVNFWVDVYAKISSWQYAIHDARYPQLVYGIFDTKNRPKGALNVEKARITKVLSGLASKAKLISEGKLKKEKLGEEELRFYNLFEKFGLLAQLGEVTKPKRLRAQAGLRDSMEDALFISGRYLPRMKIVFEQFQLPTEIAYLPFVESGFNKKAVSKVGASGIWQFMPYTGKLYLRVDDEVDERNDPMRAAEAAARLMRQNHELLEDWPLAITAYNHGAMGIARGVKEVGSRSLADLIEKYEGKTFGFASQNFYASFLAAVHVAKNSEFFLGSVPRARKLEFDEFVMPHYLDLKIFLERMSIDVATFRELNPGLTEAVYSGRKYLPVGYTVRIPMEIREDFFMRYEAIPQEYKLKEQRADEEFAGARSAASETEASAEAAGLIIDHKTE